MSDDDPIAAAAHSLNEELTIILSAERKARPYIEPGHAAEFWINELRRAAVRAAELTRRLQRIPREWPENDP